MTEAANGLFTPGAVRTFDQTATQVLGISGYALMERAAAAVCAAALTHYPAARRWVVLCGPGHNGGDGYLIARAGRRAGREVGVCALAEPEQLTGTRRGPAGPTGRRVGCWCPSSPGF